MAGKVEIFLNLLPPPTLTMMQHPLVGHELLIIDASRSHSYTQHSVGQLWPRDLPIAESCTSQQSQKTNVHASSGIRTRNPSNRLAADPCHRTRSHWERHFLNHSNSYGLPAFSPPLSYKDLAFYQTYKEPRYRQASLPVKVTVPQKQFLEHQMIHTTNICTIL